VRIDISVAAPTTVERSRVTMTRLPAIEMGTPYTLEQGQCQVISKQKQRSSNPQRL
jgi:hypothetical protein